MQKLFEKMLKGENIRPEKLGYDRPSIKLLSFLKKHYGLSNYDTQSNNFVVYRDYFQPEPKKEVKIA
jgi:alpha-tubulin N-acetyltransferase 1